MPGDLLLGLTKITVVESSYLKKYFLSGVSWLRLPSRLSLLTEKVTRTVAGHDNYVLCTYYRYGMDHYASLSTLQLLFFS